MKLIIIILCLSPILMLSGCHSSGDTKEISQTEYEELVSFARNVIQNMPSNKLSITEKKHVQNTPPVFRVYYSENKTGRYSLSWETPNKKTIQYLGKGYILNYKRSFNGINIVSVKIDKDENDTGEIFL